ncbi:MAG: four helix bundle protein [bacterium]
MCPLARQGPERARGQTVGLVRRFEDLKAWQAARMLTGQVYRLVRLPALRNDHGLADQMRRASVSTMNNIAEGFDSSSRNEFKRFLRYAIRSASEIQSCLYVALDEKCIDRATFQSVYDQAQKVRQLCSGLVRRLTAYSKAVGGGEGRVNESPMYYTQLKTPDGGARRAHGRTGILAHELPGFSTEPRA